ncbi:unnamed protein product [Cunninghamella echinulata]
MLKRPIAIKKTIDSKDIQEQVINKNRHNNGMHHQHSRQKEYEQRYNHSASRYVQDLDNLQIRQWPPGIAYDSIYYLGDTAELQFLSEKIKLDDNSTWKGHRIKKFGDRIVLVDSSVDEKNISGNKIPHLQWKSVAPKLHDIHGYIYAVTGVDQYTSTRLLKIYFANVHPILPVINKIEFLKQYRNQAETYPSAELLNAMFGAAARFVECEHLEPTHLKTVPFDAVWDLPMGWSDHFFDQAQDIISRWTANPTDSKIQAIILIQNHRGNLDSKSSACWLMGGFAIRLAQMIGLHKNCDSWDISESERQTRKRVFWSLYVSDRFQSALSGKPLSIQDEDIDVSYPETSTTWKEILDKYDDCDDFYGPRFPSAMSSPQMIDGNGEIYQLLVQFIKLSEILGKIIQGIYSPQAQQRSYEYGSHALVTSLDHELTEWRFAFSKALRQSKYDDFDENTGYFSPVIASMQLFYFSALILLHRPFIQVNEAGKHISKSSFSSSQICSSAATRGIKIASSMSIRDFLLCPYSFSLYPVMQCCLIHIYNIDHPDIQISNSAKIDLEKGMDLLDRLRDMSSSAKKLNILLQNILDNKQHIHTNDNVNNNSRKNNFTFMDLTSASGTKSIPSEMKEDITSTSSSVERMNSEWNSTFSQNNILNFNTPISASTSSSLPSINVYNPHQHDRHYNKLFSENKKNENFRIQEAFTLRQFGLSSSLSTKTTTTNNNNNNNTNNDQQYKSNLTTSSMASEKSNENSSPNEILFRNDPNNTFFGIPSSMNWGEWDGWLERTMASDSNWQSLEPS